MAKKYFFRVGMGIGCDKINRGQAPINLEGSQSFES